MTILPEPSDKVLLFGQRQQRFVGKCINYSVSPGKYVERFGWVYLEGIVEYDAFVITQTGTTTNRLRLEVWLARCAGYYLPAFVVQVETSSVTVLRVDQAVRENE